MGKQRWVTWASGLRRPLGALALLGALELFVGRGIGLGWAQSAVGLFPQANASATKPGVPIPTSRPEVELGPELDWPAPLPARRFARSLDVPPEFGSLGGVPERLNRRIRTTLDDTAESGLATGPQPDAPELSEPPPTLTLVPQIPFGVARFPAIEPALGAASFEHVQVRSTLSSENAGWSAGRTVRSALVEDAPVAEFRRTFRRSLD